MGFQCRQFYIKDDQCAMKVSTDSLILGSYVPLAGVTTALDLGTGSGLLALMVAQRAPQATITALELDVTAAQQAQENVTASPWANRLQVIQTDIKDWCSAARFDLVLCNPPYFGDHLASANRARQLARQGHDNLLIWAQCAAKHLSATGRFYWVLPVAMSQQLDHEMAAQGWFLADCLEIHTTVRKPVKLVVQGWQRLPVQQCEHERLTIHEGGGYSAAYRQLTGEFYLAGGVVD